LFIPKLAVLFSFDKALKKHSNRSSAGLIAEIDVTQMQFTGRMFNFEMQMPF